MYIHGHMHYAKYLKHANIPQLTLVNRPMKIKIVMDKINRIFPEMNYYCPIPFFLEYKKTQ